MAYNADRKVLEKGSLPGLLPLQILEAYLVQRIERVFLDLLPIAHLQRQLNDENSQIFILSSLTEY